MGHQGNTEALGAGGHIERVSQVLSSTVFGIDAHLVEVQVDISRGLPSFIIVGLPETTVKESRDRVKAAVKNTGYKFPTDRIIVNLAPADVKKEGSGLDLPIAVGILSCAGVIDPSRLKGYALVGELSLDGRVKPVRGVLPMAVAAREKGLRGIIVPQQNVQEAAVVRGVDAFGVENLVEVVEFFNCPGAREPVKLDMESLFEEGRDEHEVDFSEVKGQHHVKRALEIAAAGGHNLLMVGPPGAGKTMLARRLPTILPRMTFEEAIETTKIYSVAGLLPSKRALISTRPFRAPHHTISDAGLIGGGQIPRPGEVSLAHNGVLFLDEALEFRRNVLDMLRQPMEDGFVTISRAMTSITYPCRFMLVAAMNPCPCGYYGDARRECTCSSSQLIKYRARASGPLLDRIDIHVEVPSLSYRELAEEGDAESSERIRKRVEEARLIQQRRFAKSRIHCNSQMTPRHLRRFCQLEAESKRLLEMAIDQLGMSARAYGRVLKISRTIADLEGQENVSSRHVLEAVQYRSLDRHVLGV